MINIMKWIILLMFVSFACEESTTEEEVTPVGSWNITSQLEYENSGCTGTYESFLDTLHSLWGNEAFTYSLVFNDMQVTNTLELSISDQVMCDAITGGEGAIDASGDSCLITYNSYSYGYSLDSLCIIFLDGSYSTGNCNVVESGVFDYETNEETITLTEYAGTDSSDTTMGTWEVNNDVLTITTSDDSSCTIISASKL